MTNTSFFDSIAARWDARETPDLEPRINRVVALSDIERGQRILDVGCGTGVLIGPLIEATGGDVSIVGLDPSEGMLSIARKKHRAPAVRFVCAGLEDSQLPSGTFDRVICNAVLPHFDDLDAALCEAFRLLVSRGLLIVSHPIGREAVNRIHREGGPAVNQDRVPRGTDLRRTLQRLGMTNVEVYDEPDFYLVRGRRP